MPFLKCWFMLERIDMRASARTEDLQDSFRLGGVVRSVLGGAQCPGPEQLRQRNACQPLADVTQELSAAHAMPT